MTNHDKTLHILSSDLWSVVNDPNVHTARLCWVEQTDFPGRCHDIKAQHGTVRQVVIASDLKKLSLAKQAWTQT